MPRPMTDAHRGLPMAVPTRYSPAVLQEMALAVTAELTPLVRRGPDGAIDAAAIACARGVEVTSKAELVEPPQMAIACRRGCSTCCQAKVLVVAPEVLRIAQYLRTTKTSDEIEALLEKIRSVDDVTRGLSRADRADAHIPCPLLDAEGGCSIHEVRPLVCRSWTSYDAGACATYWEHPRGQLTPPQWPVGYELMQAMLAALGRACLDAGLDGVPLEFIAALRFALERANAGDRWSKRLPVFQAARDAEWANQAR